MILIGLTCCLMILYVNQSLSLKLLTQAMTQNFKQTIHMYLCVSENNYFLEKNYN